MPDENKILEDILNGRIRFQRFTRTEQGGSSDAADRFLWLALLRAELELGSADGGGMCPGKGLSPCGTFSPNRFLETLSQELPDTFGKLERQAGAFKDRGQESVVFDGGDSSSTDSDPGSGEHLKFYNGDYYVSDLQPGRNTVIDADTGKVRFIDPRITLNDPNGPITPVSRYGCRCEAVSPMRPADWR